MKKRNAMRKLDAAKIEYIAIEYDTSDGMLDGVSVAAKIDKPTTQVFKTLVTKGHSGEYFVFVIPVDHELDLKKAASASAEKKIEMIPVKDITKVTGYIKGGCSPIGMKKQFNTYIDKSALNLSTIVVSAGLIGMQIELSPINLTELINATTVNLIY